MHLEEYTGVRGDADVPGRLRVAIVFVDLAGFTSLTDAMGDQVAASVLEPFGQIVRTSIGQWGGRIIKQPPRMLKTVKDACNPHPSVFEHDPLLNRTRQCLSAQTYLVQATPSSRARRDASSGSADPLGTLVRPPVTPDQRRTPDSPAGGER
jgi:hypothetical protein